MTNQQSAPQSPNSRRTVLAACSSLHVVHDGISNLIYVLLPGVAQHFGLSYAQVGLVRAAYGLAMSMFQMPAGLLGERVGERLILIVGTVLTGVLFALSPLSSGFTLFLTLMFAVGTAQAVQHPLCSSLVARAFSDGNQRGAMGTYNFAGDLGKFAVAGVAGFFIARGAEWQITVYVTGGTTALLAVVFWVLLTRLDIGGAVAKGCEQPKHVPLFQRGSLGVRDNLGFGALCFIGIIDNSVRTGVLTFVAFLMVAKDIGEGWVALSIPMLIAGGMFGKLACGFLADRFGVYRTVLATELATAAGIIGIVVLPGQIGFLILPLLGVALNGTSSVLYGTIGELVESDRQPRTFGMFYTLSSFAGMVAPLIYGQMGDLIGISPALLVMSATVLATLPLTWVLSQRLAMLTPSAP